MYQITWYILHLERFGSNLKSKGHLSLMRLPDMQNVTIFYNSPKKKKLNSTSLYNSVLNCSNLFLVKVGMGPH